MARYELSRICVAALGLWTTVVSAVSVVKQFDQDVEDDMNKLLTLLGQDSVPDRYKPKEDFRKWGLDEKVTLLTGWSWASCGGPNDIITVANLTVEPDPIKLPGTLTISGAAKISTTIPDSITVELTIKKKVGPIFIRIPCIDHVGSCTYTNICEILASIPACPAPVEKFVQNCTCPINSSDGFYMPPSDFVVNTGETLPTGDYEIEARVTREGQPVVCIDVTFTITH